LGLTLDKGSRSVEHEPISDTANGDDRVLRSKGRPDELGAEGLHRQPVTRRSPFFLKGGMTGAARVGSRDDCPFGLIGFLEDGLFAPTCRKCRANHNTGGRRSVLPH